MAQDTETKIGKSRLVAMGAGLLAPLLLAYAGQVLAKASLEIRAATLGVRHDH